MPVRKLRRCARWVVPLLGATLTGVLSVTSPGVALARQAAPAATRVMVVGDSISQGLEGDYTWRYRLADHFARYGTAVDFVGPWTGTNVLPARYPDGWPDVAVPPSRTGAYRPGVGFDSEHLSQWGWQMHQAKDVIASNVRTYTPDFLLVELGFNDLAWGVNDPAGLLADLRSLIASARSARPDVRILVANVPHRTPLAQQPNLPAVISNYNALLAGSVAGMSTSSSPVLLTDIDGPYDENRDTYDGLHPNVRGEYVIAKAFADTLFGNFWFGGTYGAVPDSVPGELLVGVPGTVTATPTDDKLFFSWSHVFGAAGYLLYQRDATAGQAFQPAVLPIGADSWTADLLPAGHRIEFYVRAMRGDSHLGVASTTAGATVRPLPEVTNLRVTANPDRPYTATLSWDPVPGADDYHVYSAPGCDLLPPPSNAFTLQQWGLGTRTSWTQEFVLDNCVNYKVAAARYGGESPLPFSVVHATPYQNNLDYGLARNRYLDTPPDAGDQKTVTSTTPQSTDRGMVVARGFIRAADAFTDAIGDHRQFDASPYASSKIGVAWDTKTGELGIYVHRSCVIGTSLPPGPIQEGCRDAYPIRLVADASVYGDGDSSAYNYVSTAMVGGNLVVTVSAVNSWSSFLGRINAKVTLTPSGGTYQATLTGDRFPAWEIYRYPRTAPLSGQAGKFYTIGTRDQTSLGDLTSGASSTCVSVPPENDGSMTNPMSCS
jgi:lysophospholipase L1-like esterase